MAVRVFDPTESQRPSLTVVEPAPRRRHDVRRTKRRWSVYGLMAMSGPFVLAVVTVWVSR
ncbi:MAG: hypothetical protein WCJ82_00270 [Actinomycetota bacterium]